MTSHHSHENDELYGRKAEEHMLLAAYHVQCSPRPPGANHEKQRSELVLITGKSGTGKTTLAKRTLVPLVEKNGGYFLSGKFDQLQRPEPHAPFVSAFSEWSHEVSTTKNQDVLQAIRDNILNKVGIDMSRLLMDSIPAMEQIIQPGRTKSRSSSVSSHDSCEQLNKHGLAITSTKNSIHQNDLQKRRFFLAFCHLICAIASPQHPLVLFLDDLQWADQGSLDLMQQLATHATRHAGFLLLGACRGNEVTIHDPLSVTLRALEDEENVHITNIALHNFTRPSVHGVVSTMFPMSQVSDVRLLAETIYQETNGNMFFMLQLVKQFQEDEILTIEQQENGNESKWKLNQDGIRNVTTRGEGNVVEMMEGVLERLPHHVLSVLQVASCLGATFRIQHLEIVLSELDIVNALQIAAKKGLVLYKHGATLGKFAHDRVQEATYSLISKDKLASMHASIGQCLHETLSKKEIQRDMFLIVNQVGVGISQIQDQQERNRLAALCLATGRQATRSSAFLTASAYLKLGMELLGPRHWREEYYLSLALFNAAAEVEYCNADFEQTDSLLNSIFLNARTFQDKIQAYNTHVFALGAQERFSEAIHTAFEVLKELGEPFPSKPTKVRVAMQILKTKWMLRGKSQDSILNLPLATDQGVLACQQMLNLVYLYVFFTHQEYVPLLCTRMIQITLKHGLCGAASSGFGTYGMLLCASRGDYDGAYKYCRLALEIMKKFDEKIWMARNYVPTYGMVFHWKEPVRNCLKPLQQARQVGCESGDIEFAMMAAALYCFHASFSGMPIPDLVREISGCVEEMRMYKQVGVLSLLLPFLQFCSNLLGESKNPFVLTGEHMDEDVYVEAQTKAGNQTNLMSLHALHAEIYFYFDEMELAFEESELAKSFIITSDSSLGKPLYLFFDGLIASELARRVRKRKYMKILRQAVKSMKKWARSCPQNFLPYCRLLEAELMVLRGNVDKALDMYDSSIQLSENEGFIHAQAIAC